MVRFTVCDVTPLDTWKHQAPHCPFQFLFLKGSLQSNTAHNRHGSFLIEVCISHQQGHGYKTWFGHQEVGSAISPCCQMMTSRNCARIYFWSRRNRKTHSVKCTQRQQTPVAIMKSLFDQVQQRESLQVHQLNHQMYMATQPNRNFKKREKQIDKCSHKKTSYKQKIH